MAAEPSHQLLGPVAVNGFPARRLTKSTSHQGGEWVTAYQAEQRSRLRAVFLSQHQRQEPGYSHCVRPPTNTREASGAARRVLDKAFLMRHCYVEQPTDLSDADISGVHLTSYNPEDIREFDCLVHISASDTTLPMEAFKMFPALEQLELLVCGISDISLDYTTFTRLQFLDLSYNSVSEMAVLTLGNLPLLRELHLTGNNIVSLPVEMSRPFRIHKEPSETARSSLKMRYASLETLWLDDNKLTDQTTFSTLAGLRKLKYVNLDNNELYTVPQLRLIGTSPLKSPATTETRRPTPGSRRSSLTPPRHHRSTTPRGSGQGSLAEKEIVSERASDSVPNIGSSPCEQGSEAAVESEPSRTVEIDRATVVEDTAENSSNKIPGMDQTQVVSKSEVEERGDKEGGRVGEGEKVGQQVRETGDTRLRESDTPTSVSFLPPSMAPFPHLHTLSLANNMFFSSEALLACSSWPSLKEIIIHGNPIINMCNGMPPRLRIELVQKRNIHIVRHKPSARMPFRIGKKAKDFKKVSSRLPVVPQQSQHLALPPPPLLDGPLMISGPSSPPSTPSPTSHPHQPHSTPTGTCDRPSAGGADCEDSVFITQGICEQDDTHILPSCDERRVATGEEGRRECGEVVKREESERRQELRAEYTVTDLPECYRGYEALLEGDTTPTTAIPTDLYGCIHALRYALKHSSSLSYKTAPSHRNHHRKVQQLVTGSMQETTTHRKVQHMHTTLNDIRSTTTVLEANLADLLQMDISTNKTSRKLQREGRHLLKQLQAKYDDVWSDCKDVHTP